MSERQKPSEIPTLRVVAETEAGEILEASPEPTPEESLLGRWERKLYAGSRISEIPPRRRTLPGWLPLDAVLAVYGPPGTGKSLYALTLGIELARGGRWASRKLEPSKVLYVAAERPTDQRDRVEAWEKHHADNLPEGFVMFAPDRPPQLTDRLHVSALCQLVEKLAPRWIILDTYARMTLGLEENSSAASGPVLDAIDQLREASKGGSVIVIHHTGKDASKGLRGSSAMLGALDLTIELSGGTDGIVKARVDKENAGPKPMPEWYRITPVLLPPIPGEAEMRSLPVMVSTGRPDEGPTEAILELVDNLGRASRKQLREGLLSEHGLEIPDSTLGRHLRDLVASGRLELEGKRGDPRAGYRIPSAPRASEELDLEASEPEIF